MNNILEREKERMRRELRLGDELERLHQQNVRGDMNVPSESNESVEDVISDIAYKSDLNRRKRVGMKIENWIILTLLIATILVALSSCSSNSNVCVDGYILESHIPTYMTCNAEQLTFTYKMDTLFQQTEDSCECEEFRIALTDSFWSLVDGKPLERQFMYYTVPASYQCVKN